MANWDQRMMDLARHVAIWSKDRSRKTSAIIVNEHYEIVATGVNGFPRGVDDDVEERHQRPAKYMWTEHAERNAIYQAAKNGHPLKGTMIYLPWYPCIDCARAIVQTGIVEMIAIEPNWDDPQWGDGFKVVREMLEEVGVHVRFMEGEAPQAK